MLAIQNYSNHFSQQSLANQNKLTYWSNNFINNLPNHLLFDIMSFLNDSPRDLNSFSLTCHLFNKFVNSHRFKKIMLVDDHNKVASTQNRSNFTILQFANLPLFINSLKKNSELLGMINEFVILTSSNPQNLNIINDVTLVNQLFMSLYKCSNLRNFEILDLNYVQIFNESFRESNSGHMTYDFNDLSEADSLVRSSFFNNFKSRYLRNLAINDLFDLNLASIKNIRNIDTLKIYIERSNSLYQISESSTSNYCFDDLQSLRNLYLNSPTTTLYFLNYIKLGNSKLNLKQLSITNSHSFKNFGFNSINTKLSFNNLNEKIELSNLSELEMKLNCDHQSCNRCIVEFFSDWDLFNKENGFDWLNIEKLSILNFKNSSFIQWSEVISRFLPHFKNLVELYINLDEFTYLPFLSVKNPSVSSSTSNPHSIQTKKLSEIRQAMFVSISSLKNLKKLVIPDFFHNWLIYLNPTEELNFLNILNRCHCQDCVSIRYNYSIISSVDAINDYNHKFNNLTMENLNLIDSIINLNFDNEFCYLKDCYNNYRLANFLLIELKKRILRKDIFSIDSTLDFWEYPISVNNFIDDGSSCFDWKTKKIFNGFVKLILHSIIEVEVKQLVNELPNLNMICFGGVYFNLQRETLAIRETEDLKTEFTESGRSPQTRIRLVALYDYFEFEFII